MLAFTYRPIRIWSRLHSNKPEIAPFITSEPKEKRRHHPILFTHGIFGNKRVWRSTCQALSDSHGYKCFSLDTRHHGDWQACPKIDYFVLAEDLRVFMDHHGIGKLHLVGHSMGGKIVMAFSQIYPDRVKSLTVVDVSPKRHSSIEKFQTYIQAMAEVDLKTAESTEQVRCALNNKLEPQISNFLLLNLNRVDGKFRWSYTFDTLMASFQTIIDFPKLEPRFTGPTKFIVGGRSEYWSEEDRPIVLGLYAHAEIEVVKDSGHNVHADQREKFLSILAEFVNLYD